MPEPKDLAAIKEVQRKARQGEYGRQRKEFGRKYREILEKSYEEIRADALRYTASIGESIQCGKGCAHCCEHFVSVTVSQAVVIADYLYASENAMAVFLRNYDKWLKSIEENPQAVIIFSSLEEDTTLSAEVRTSPQELLHAYFTFAVPCPFLDKTRCAIYAVRPLCCAAYFAVTPPEFCRADVSSPPLVLEVKPSEKNLRALVQLADPRLSLHQESLPKLVYKLLTAGLPEVSRELDTLFALPKQTGAGNPKP